MPLPVNAKHLAYWEYDPDATIECPACGWAGRCEDHQRLFRDLLDVECLDCERMLLIVSFPTDDETRAAAAAGNKEARREMAEVKRRAVLDRLRAKYELTSADQLPDLPGDEIVVVWDQIEATLDSRKASYWTVLRHGTLELWREPIYYEGIERLEVIARILQTKYGARLVEIRPTKDSEVYLYGDLLSARDILQRVNQALRDGRPV